MPPSVYLKKYQILRKQFPVLCETLQARRSSVTHTSIDMLRVTSQSDEKFTVIFITSQFNINKMTTFFSLKKTLIFFFFFCRRH